MPEKRHVSVLVRHEEELDTDRIEEWIRANFKDGDYVQVQDMQTGEMYYDNIGSDTL